MNLLYLLKYSNKRKRIYKISNFDNTEAQYIISLIT